jgi:hypothetical protein
MKETNLKDWYNNVDGPETVKRFKDTDIILGHDMDTGNVFLVYGRETMKRIVDTGKTESLTFEKVSIRQSTTELEMLLAAVNVAKGHDDYMSTADQTIVQTEVDELKRIFSLTDGMHRSKTGTEEKKAE